MGMGWYELAIIAFILIGIGFVIFRTGAANPVGTGRLAADVSKIRTRVGTMEIDLDNVKAQLGNCATTGDVEKLEERLKDLNTTVATRDDIEHLLTLMARDSQLTERTWLAVNHLQKFFIEQGAGGGSKG